MLPEWGEAAQLALRDASVLVVGAGALGSPVAPYLAGAGVGRLGIVDGDEVELSNLHRQLLHFTPDVGVPKAHSAAAKLGFLNPEVVVEPYQVRLEPQRRRLLEGNDLVVDCSDSFETRYAVNAACCAAGSRSWRAACWASGGLVMAIRPGGTACYRCAFPEPPPSAPSCAEAGVLGPAAGVIGSLQALEALKLLAGLGGALLDAFLQVDLPGSRSCAWPSRGGRTARTAVRVRCRRCSARDPAPASPARSAATSPPRASATRPPAASRAPEILAAWPGVHALLTHRVAHALDEAGVPVAPARAGARRAHLTGIEIHPARRRRRRAVHRPRDGRGDRRDGRDRRERDDLPGRHARRHRLRDRQAPPDGRGQRDDRLRRQAARPDPRSATARRSAPTPSSSTTCRRTRPWSATPAIRCGSRAAGPRARTPTGSTCPTRSPTR